MLQRGVQDDRVNIKSVNFAEYDHRGTVHIRGSGLARHHTLVFFDLDLTASGIGFAALEEQIGSLERHRVGLIRRGYCVFRDLHDPQHIRIRKSRSGDLDNVFGAGIMVFVVDTA